MAYISGKNGRFKVGSTNVPCQRWSANIRGTALETTNSEGSGYEEYVAGVAGADIEADLNYDTASALLNVCLPNTSYTVVLYPALGTAGNNFTGTVFVESATIQSEVKGLVTIRVRGKATGSYTVANL